MRDPNLAILLGLAVILFAGVAASVHRLTARFSVRAGIRPPHPTLLTVKRLWFALLSLGSLTLLVLSFLHG